MTRRGGIYRIFIKCSIFILAFAAVFCGFMRSYSESGTLEAVFDMEEEKLVIPTNTTQITLCTGPGFLYPVKMNITDCERLEVLEKGLWYKVKYNDSEGYVYSSLFIDEKGFAANRLDGVYIGIDVVGSYDARSGVSWAGQINLKIGMKLKSVLEAAGAVVIMPRTSFESDELVNAVVRAEIFNKYNCDIIYQINAISSPVPSESGPQIWLAPGSPIRKCAEILADDLGEVAGKQKTPVTEWTGSIFLNYVKSPAMSLCPGYLTNDPDWERLNTDAYQDALISVIREFTVDYIYEYKMDGGSVTGDL